MKLPAGNSPQNNEFYDPEGLAYIGNGRFVMTEERNRTAVLFNYAAGTPLQRALSLGLGKNRVFLVDCRNRRF